MRTALARVAPNRGILKVGGALCGVAGVTRVDLQPRGEAMFPPIDRNVWKEVGRSEHAAGPGDDAPFAVLVYERA